MKKCRTIRILLCLLILFWTGAACAQATSAFSLSLGELEIKPQEKGEDILLFVPGSWEGQPVTVHTGAEAGVLINGELYHNGDAAPVFENRETVTYRRADKKQNQRLKVYIGSKIPALMLSVAEEDLYAIHKDKSVNVPAQLTALRADGSVELSAPVSGLKTRGNTTLKYPKKPYQIKLDEKADLFGLGESKKFILLADYLDISLLRNRITYDMARASGLPYALSCLQADVYINGEYRGLYLLTEKIEIGSASVDIHNLEKETEKLNEEDLDSYEWYAGDSEGLRNARWYSIPNNPEDVSGGYILETDKVYRYKEETDAGFITANNMAVYIKEPEAPSEQQTKYISGVVNAFHRAVISRNGVDPETGVSYTEMIDMPSFARKYLLEEISKNFDALLGSQYFFKERGDDRLYAGPAWDYDLSYGNIQMEGFKKHSYPNGFYLPSYDSSEFWYNNLISHPEFEALVQETYCEVFHPLLEVLTGKREPEEGSPLRSLADYQAEIQSSAEMNFARWLPASIKDYYKGAGTNFNQGVSYLFNFIEYRLAFLDREWLK